VQETDDNDIPRRQILGISKLEKIQKVRPKKTLSSWSQRFKSDANGRPPSFKCGTFVDVNLKRD